MGKKIVVLFPGVGYHNDKPLLYYSKKIAKNYDYEIVETSYEIMDAATLIKSDQEKMQEAFEAAFNQIDKQLKEINFADYERVIFVGKSIGTAIMARYAMTYDLDPDMIIFTPIAATFSFLAPCEGLVFHGSSDPLCDTDMCVQLCEEMSLTYAVIPEANHSLETGNVETDIKNLGMVMRSVNKIFSL